MKRLLRPGGEVHIIDSPFYANEATRARARAATLRYYTTQGVPGMAVFYHHHCWSELPAAGLSNLNAGIWARMLQKLKWWAPFPWLRVQL